MIEFEPKWIAWEITRRCNLRCVHCRSSSEAEVKGHPDFSTQEAFRVLDDIASYAKPVVVLSGGEPLVREDVFEIARYGTEKGLRMCLATNGVLVTEETCAKIRDSGIRIVSLSLDGSSEKVHDDFRNQEGAFRGTINAAGLFRKHGIEFLVNSSFTRRNQEEIPEVYRLAKELGATAWYMFMIVPTGRGEEIMNELISSEDYEEILEWHYRKEDTEVLHRRGQGLHSRAAHMPHRRGRQRPALQLFPEGGRQHKGAVLQGHLGELPPVPRHAELQGLQGQVRLVRVHQRLRGLPRQGLCHPRRLHGGGALLRLRAREDEEKGRRLTGRGVVPPMGRRFAVKY
jgi:MoaA/NifB/PqqE/SkfB family radical SAM enzyme